MGWINRAYISLGLTVYAYCGKWVASPGLGSAGPTIKINFYAVYTWYERRCDDLRSRRSEESLCAVPSWYPPSDREY